MAQNSNTAPPLLDLTIDNITPNTVRINSQSGRPRLTYLMERLVTHLHDFARETRLSTDEWMAALKFLVECGQISSDVRQVRMYMSPLYCHLIVLTNGARNLSCCRMSSGCPC
jgi:hypothetical protein